MRGAEFKGRDAEVEQLLGSGRLPKSPCCHLRRFVSGMGSVKKERAAASTFKTRAPHRSSCSRRAEEGRRPSTEIRLDVNSALQTYEPPLASFVPRAGCANGRDPPRAHRRQRCKPHPRLTRWAFSDKGLLNPSEEALGRSKGGFSTKVHLACDGKGRPLSVVVTPGQPHGSTQLEELLDAVRVGREAGEPGRPRKRPSHLLAERGYSYERCRRLLRKRGVSHTIPERKDQKERRAGRSRDAGPASTGRLTAGATWSRGA